MRFIFFNPQIDLHYGRTLYYFLIRAKSYNRYTYLLNYAYSKQGKMFVYVDDKFKTFPFLPLSVEIYLWSMLNKFNPFKLRVLRSKDLKYGDVILCFSYGDLIGENKSLEVIKNKKVTKLMHVTHFFIQTSKIAQNYKKYKFTEMVGENNLTKNSKYFRKYFPFFKKNVYLLPFVFQPRFKKVKKFEERKNKCLATGTYQDLRYSHAKSQYNELTSFFNINCLHPMREEIYLNRVELKSFIDSYIGKRFDKLPKKGKANDTKIKKIINSVHNVLFAKQSKYFSFDIVEKYNQYRMFVVPEEISGLPSVGFVEGMACGAAYIGKKDPMYEELGLKSGKHYIGYDGSLSDLKKKIGYYQKHPKELEKIAETGYRFVTENFNGEKVARIFWNDLEKYVKGKDRKLDSSFAKNWKAG